MVRAASLRGRLPRLRLVVILGFFGIRRRNGVIDTAGMFSQTVKKTIETIDDLS
jgi:hypothetical protein